MTGTVWPIVIAKSPRTRALETETIENSDNDERQEYRWHTHQQGYRQRGEFATLKRVDERRTRNEEGQR